MNRIILALDTTDLEKSINTTKKIKDKIFTVKLGLEFFNAHGKEGVKKFNEIGLTNLMLDLKLKDIPQTVHRSILALSDINFGYLTIHGQGGKKMIEQAKKAASEIKSKPKIFLMHGTNDTIVPPIHLLEAKEYLKKCGLKIKIKFFKDHYNKSILYSDSLDEKYLESCNSRILRD